VGVIPEDWSVSSVGKEFTVQLGKMLDAAKNVGTLKPYIGNRAVQWGRVELDAIATVPMTQSDLQRFRLRAGDLLVCEGGEIGRAAIWKEPISECYYQKALHRLRAKRGYDAPLLRYLLELWASSGYLANHVTQTSIAHLPKDKLEVVPIPLPPLPEQRAIAGALSDVDELIGALDRLIAKKRAIKQATMQQLLTGKTRLPGFRGEWVECSLRSCLRSPPAYGINAAAVTADERLPTYLRITDIGEDCRFRPSPLVSVKHPGARDFLLQVGDLVFARTGASVGKSYLYDPRDGPLVFAGFLIRIRPDSTRLLPTFLAHFAQSKRFWDWVAAVSARSGQPGINGRQYETLQLHLPPANEQSAIATVLSDMDAEIAALEERRDKTKAIKQGMMQELLTGRVRLVDPEKAATA
jgi:type I restriction enzyme, S subunit